MRAEVHCGDVAHRQSGVGLRSPAPGFVEVRDFEFVDPYGAVLGHGRVVAHADEDDTDVAQRRIAHDRYAVALVVGVAAGVERSVPYSALLLTLGAVALALEVDEVLEIEVEVVVQRPYDSPLCRRIAVVVSRRGNLEGHLILIEVVLHIGAKTDEHRQVARTGIGDVVYRSFGMDPHLHTLIVAEVLLRIAVYAACIAGGKTGEFERHRLLVQLRDLALPGVGDTRHAGREDVVDGLALCVLLDVDHGHVEFSRSRSVAAGVEVEVVAAPLAADEFERGETQMNGFLESRQEHTCEAYGREVIDGAYDFLIVLQRYLELIPFHHQRSALGRGLNRHLLVGDEVAAHLEVLRTD